MHILNPRQAVLTAWIRGPNNSHVPWMHRPDPGNTQVSDLVSPNWTVSKLPHSYTGSQGYWCATGSDCQQYSLLFLATPHGMQDLSSLTRDRILASTVEARILNQWTTKEVPINSILLDHVCVCSVMSDSLQPSGLSVSQAGKNESSKYKNFPKVS